SNSVRPGDLRLLLGSPPSRCLTTSVVRFSTLILLTPATYCPSHFRRNLKFLYGSKRCWFTTNCAIALSLDLDLSRQLLDLDDDKLRGLQWCKADHDVDDALIDIILRSGFTVALHEIRFLRGGSLECALAK